MSTIADTHISRIGILSEEHRRLFLRSTIALIAGADLIYGLFWLVVGFRELALAYALFILCTIILLKYESWSRAYVSVTYWTLTLATVSIVWPVAMTWQISVISLGYLPALFMGSLLLQGRRLAVIAAAIGLMSLVLAPLLGQYVDTGFRLNPAQLMFYQIAQSISVFFVICTLTYLNDAELQALLGKLLKNKAELEQTQENLLLTQHYRNRFFASISHEIRTPMNAIRGIADLLHQKTSLNEEEAHLVLSLKSSSSHLISVINDLLDLSKLESDKLSFENESFDLQREVDDACAMVGFAAQEKKLAFQHECQNAHRIMLMGDANRLRQVLVNLLNNAVKFTEQGSVRLSYRFEQKEASQTEKPGKGILRFEVKDTGVGIAPEVERKLFGDYVQGTAQINKKNGGTGLGLFITKRIIDKLGGQIAYASIPNEGTVFYVSIPFEMSAEESVEENVQLRIEAQLAKGREHRREMECTFMIVDDNQLNILVAQKLLLKEYPHAQFLTAQNGIAALQLLAQAERLPDIILMDVLMPEMDGVEATRAIRKSHDSAKASIPIIAMTANIYDDEMQRCMDAGMNDFLGKPFEIAALVEKTEAILANRTTPSSAHSVPMTASK